MSCGNCGNEGVRCHTTQKAIISSVAVIYGIALYYPKAVVKAVLAAVCVVVAAYLWDNQSDNAHHNSGDHAHAELHENPIDSYEERYVDHTGEI